MTTPEQRLDRLEAIEAIRQIPQRFARAIDERDIDALSLLFDPEGEIETGGRAVPVTDFLADLRDRPRAFDTSMHLLADPLVEVDAAAGTASMDVYALVVQVGRTDGGSDMMLGVRYLHALRRAADGWRIVHRASDIRWIR